ncbi:hypothetical protein [Flavobacterium sp. FlaQc-48]|uniref:hypothetical protein n=1 Tax=Flavobacterium sp. FlaQc-48 TaxID=3374181 RepID=UPI003757E748
MAREIKNLPLTAPNMVPPQTPSATSFDDFKDRLVKLIPSEIVTAYVTIQGLVAGATLNQDAEFGYLNKGSNNLLLWIVVILLLIMTPVYLYYVTNVRKWGQILYTTIAFFIWVLVIGGPIKEIIGYSAQFIGSILLIFYTLFIPVIYKG